MGTFGYVNVGGTQKTISLYAYDCKFQMDALAGQQAISITWYLTGPEPQGFKVAIYDVALNLLGQGTGTKEADGWITVTLDSPINLTASAWYWLAGRAETEVTHCYYTGGAANQGAYAGGEEGNYPNFPVNPMPVAGYNARKYSVYCTYEDAPAPPEVIPRAPAYGLDPMVF